VAERRVKISLTSRTRIGRKCTPTQIRGARTRDRASLVRAVDDRVLAAAPTTSSSLAAIWATRTGYATIVVCAATKRAPRHYDANPRARTLLRRTSESERTRGARARRTDEWSRVNGGGGGGVRPPAGRSNLFGFRRTKSERP